MNLPRNSVNATTPENNLYVELLKNRISDLEKQLTEKNVIINFLTTQLVTKSQDTSVHNNFRNNKHQKGTRISNSDKVDDVPLKRSINKTPNNKTSNNVVVIGDSMLNNINARGLSKSKKVDVFNFPGATSSDIVNEIDEVLKGKPESLIINIGTNDLTNNINLLANVKNIVNKVKNTSPDTVLSFSDFVFRKDKKNIERMRADTSSRLKNFCKQKSIKLILNDNLKEEHLGIKKLYLNKKGNTVFARNVLNFIGGN